MGRKFVWIVFISICFVALYSINVFTNSALETPELEIQPHPEKIYETVALYFRCPIEDILVKEYRGIERTFESRSEIILRELINGPDNNMLHPTLSPRTKIYSVIAVGDTVYVNFSEEFYKDLPIQEIDEVLATFSVVNSLAENYDDKKVQILIEGERPYVFLRYLSLREPLFKNERITKETLVAPIDVLRKYFKHLENQEIRRAFDQIYRTTAIGIDYSIYFHETMKNIQNYKTIEIKSFTISHSDEGITLTVDYVVELMSGELIQHENKTYRFRNHFGEWKIFKNDEL
ncbi:MAG: GerMN domain-containing protein [Alkaliphilus sp.]